MFPLREVSALMLEPYVTQAVGMGAAARLPVDVAVLIALLLGRCHRRFF